MSEIKSAVVLGAARTAIGRFGGALKDVPLEPNKTYRFSFTGHSNSGNDVQARIFQHSYPYSSYGLNQVFDLTTETRSYSALFTTPTTP